METLKTLKDLDSNCYPFDERLKKKIHYPKTAEQLKSELRQEAIKWVKEIYKIQPDKEEPITFIKHFFNITEMEINNEK